MRNLSFCREKWDKRYFLAFCIVLLCSIICGLVLCKFVNYNNYLRNLVSDYVYNVFNFKNTSLVFAHLLGDILYCYVFFVLGYLTKFKYFNLIVLFLRGLFFGIYCVLMVTVASFSGVIVLIFVFVPSTLISMALCFISSEFCGMVDRKYAFLVPAALALIDCIIMLLLINVLFRVVIIIV